MRWTFCSRMQATTWEGLMWSTVGKHSKTEELKSFLMIWYLWLHVNKSTFPQLLSSFKGREVDPERAGCWNQVKRCCRMRTMSILLVKQQSESLETTSSNKEVQFHQSSALKVWLMDHFWNAPVVIGSLSHIQDVHLPTVSTSIKVDDKTKEITFMPAAWIKWNFLSPPRLSQLFLPQTSKPYLHLYKICLQSTSLRYWSFPPSPPGLRHKAKLARCLQTTEPAAPNRAHRK